MTLSICGGPTIRRTLITAAALLICAAVAVAAGLLAEQVQAHPDRPVPTGTRVQSDPTEANPGDIVELTGHEFTDDSNLTFHVQQDTESDQCDISAPAVLTFNSSDLTDAKTEDGSLTVRWRVDPIAASGATTILVCASDDVGIASETGAIIDLGAPKIELSAHRAYAGETVEITGEHWYPRRNVEVFAFQAGDVKYREDGRPLIDCAEKTYTDTADAEQPMDIVAPQISVRTRDDGTFSTDYQMTGEPHYRAIQWIVCAVSTNKDGEDVWRHEHFHLIHTLRATVPDEFEHESILLLDKANQIHVIPGVPAGVEIEWIEVAGIKVIEDQPGNPIQERRDRGHFSTWVEITPTSGDLPEGEAIVAVRLSEAVDDENEIRAVMEVRTDYVPNVRIIGPQQASPEDTITFGGENFADLQDGIIYGFVLPDSPTDTCPDYAPGSHPVSFNVTADDNGVVPDTEFTLSADEFKKHKRWLFCAADGAGQKSAPHPLEITPTVLAVNLDRRTIVRGRDNELRIIPPLAAGESITGWTIGPDTNTTAVPEEDLTRKETETRFSLSTNVQPGRYTLVLNIDRNEASEEDTAISNVFRVVPPGTVIGDLAIAADAKQAGPMETINLSGAGFTPEQTVRFYAQIADETEEFPTCRPYQDGDPTGTATADDAGAWGPIAFQLKDERFSSRDRKPWLFCAEDGSGNRTITPSKIAIRRVIQLPRHGDSIVRGQDNQIWIAPGLPSNARITAWAIGPQQPTNAVARTEDGQRTRITVHPDLPNGAYTLRVITTAGTISRPVQVVDSIPVTPTNGAINAINAIPNEAGPGQTISLSGTDAAPDLTVQIYGQPAEDGSAACQPYANGDPDITTAAGADRTWGPVELTLDDTRFNDSSLTPWRFCATDGAGQTTDIGAIVTIVRAMQFANQNSILLKDTANDVWISPALPTDATVTGWTIGSQTHDTSIPATAAGSRSLIRITPTVDEGDYTLTVQTTAGDLTAKVTVSTDSSITGDPFITAPAESVEIGDTVTIMGGNLTPNQTVLIHAVPPSDSISCAGLALADAWGATTANANGAFDAPLVADEDTFTVAGQWRLCATGGDGAATTSPATMSVLHTIIVPRDQVVQLRSNRIRIHPPLAAGSTLTSAALSGRNHPDTTLESSTDTETTLLFRTATPPGTYTLVLNFAPQQRLTREIEIIPQQNPPTLTIETNLQFETPISINGAGFSPDAAITLLATPGTDNSEGGQDPLTCAQMIEPPTGVTVTQIEEWGDQPIVADADGALNTNGNLPIDDFNVTGPWLLCANDSDGNITDSPSAVTVLPTIRLEDLDGRVRAGSESIIRVIPPLRGDASVTALRLGERPQQFTTAGGGIVWTTVPNRTGSHELTAVIDGFETTAVVTILSGRRPDSTIPATARECAGITGMLDQSGPGASTGLSFTFRITPEGHLECPLPELDDDANNEPRIILPEATTILPDDDVVIKLRPAYRIPGSGASSAEISSYANRFGFRFLTSGTRFNSSSGPSDNHEITVPPCSQWLDQQSDQAPCVIEHAREITIHIGQRFTLPMDAAQEYATQIQYKGRTIWDLVTVNATLQADTERAPYNGEVTFTGAGFGFGNPVTIKGVNTSDPRFEIPEAEGIDEWNCALIAELGDDIADATTDSENTFDRTVDIHHTAFDKPGHWLVCAVTGTVTTSRPPTPVTIDYEAIPSVPNTYSAGSTEYIRVNPTPTTDDQPTGVTIGGNDVDHEQQGDRTYFTMPINITGEVKALITFDDDLRAETTIRASGPALETRDTDVSDGVRIGSVIRIEARQVGGERICAGAIDEIPIDLLTGDETTECVTIGPNQRLSAAVLIATDGQSSPELVKLFDEASRADLTLTTDTGQELTTTVTLKKPSLSLSDNGAAIRRNVLRHFKPVTVTGTGFPNEGPHFDAPRVGYTVEDQSSWDTRTSDGAWKHQFRMTGDVEEGLQIAFVPTINGVQMPSLSRTLTIGVATPELTVTPDVLETGIKTTIRATGLPGFRSGYWLGIEELGSHRFALTDGATGNTFHATTDGNGTFEAEITFPDWEAMDYEEDNTTVVELQLYNSAGAPIPNGKVEIKHRRPEPERPATGPGGQLQVTVTPLPTSSADGIYVTPVLPDPTRPVRPEVTVPPLPTRPLDTGVRADTSTPDPVDHNNVVVKPGPDGKWIQLEWNPAGGSMPADGYVILRADSPDAEPIEVDEPHRGSIPTYRDRSVEPNTTYWYYIKPSNINGVGDLDDTAPGIAETPARPSVPRSLRAETTGATIVRVTWLAPDIAEDSRPQPVTGFTLEYRPAGAEEWTHVARVSAYIREWVIIDLKHGTDYEIRMAALNEVGRGPWTPALPVTTAGEAIKINEARLAAITPTQTAGAAITIPDPTISEEDGSSLTGSQATNRWLLFITAIVAIMATLAIIATVRKRRRIAALRDEAQRAQATEPQTVPMDDEEEDDRTRTLPEPRWEAPEAEDEDPPENVNLGNVEEADLQQLIEQLRNMDTTDTSPPPDQPTER